MYSEIRLALRRSLRLRLLLPLATCFLLGTAAISWWGYEHSRRILLDNAFEHAEILARQLARSTGERSDPLAVQKLLSQQLSDPDLRAIELVGGSPPRVLAATDPRRVGRAAEPSPPDAAHFDGARGILRSRAPVEFSHELASDELPARADLVVELDAGHVLHDARRRVMEDGLALALLTLLLVTGAYISLHRHVLGPIGAIGQALRRFGEDREILRLDLPPNEIGHLADELRQMQRQVFHRESQLEAVVSTAADAIIVIDAEGHIEEFNRAAEKMFGYRRDEILGANALELMAPDESEGGENAIARYLRTGQRQGVEDYQEAQALHRDGSTCPVQIAVAEFELEGEHRFVGILRDLSEQRRAEENLRAYATALEKASLRAQRSAETKAEFLANMSHEIRTPMTAILGYVELLLEEDVDPHERRSHLRTVRNNGEHLLALINDILDLSKIEADKLELESRPVDVPEFVASVVQLLRFKAENKGLRLTIDNEGTIGRSLRTDPTRLRQVLVNLVGNAIKFTREGGVRIRLRQPGDGRTLYFDVIDTGIGIPAEHQEKIFESFGQADASTTREYGGTGLGLTISRHLALRLGGDIALESEPGRGSTFTVSVPTFDPPAETPIDDLVAAIEQASLEAKAPADSTSGASMRGRVLVAEDNAVNQKLIERLLQREGLEVTLAENGRQACEAALTARAEGQDFQLVLMDMQMPILNGYEATEQLREEGYDAPIVALTANAMAGDRERCIEAGCDDYLPKPIDKAVLREILQRHLGSPTPESVA